MSLAARCPWCETVFRLTEGQISAKGGMARCGVCNHTFNALEALLSDSAVAALERGAQAREANQEATARANEQVASKAVEAPPIPIPISIRKIFGGLSTPTAAPAESGSPAAPVSAPLPTPRTSFSASPEATPSPFSVPTAGPASEPAPALPIAERKPEAIHTSRAIAPVESAPVPVPVQVPMPASTSPAPQAAHHGTEAQPVNQPAQPTEPTEPTQQTQQTQQTLQPDARNASVEAPASEVAQVAPAAAIPTDYTVEMPNYDAERAAALAEAERLQKEKQEGQEQQQRRKTQQASAAIEHQIDEVQSALSPVSPAEQVEREAVDLVPTSATLNALRLQHAAVQAASKADQLREQERLGPSTFQPSFLSASPAPGRFRRTRRFFGGVLALVLFTCLLAQAVYWWRSDVAMRVPQTRPYLVRACERLHCEVEPPAQIDQLSIESSELVAAPGASGALAFTALVRNHSSNALAYPAIEITLTDARDQAILRRVFLPDAYLGDALGTKRLAGLSGNSEYTLKLTFNTSGVATAGYRAGIFYP